MATPFDTLFTATAAAVLSEQFAETISVQRGSLSTSGVTEQGFPGQGQKTSEHGYVLATFDTCDWIILVSDYLINGEAVDPSGGDLFTDGDDNEWEVLPLENKRTHELIEGGNAWLIHTKAVQNT